MADTDPIRRAYELGAEQGEAARLGGRPEPDLSGQWADALTPSWLCRLVGVDPADESADDVCGAYERGVSDTWLAGAGGIIDDEVYGAERLFAAHGREVDGQWAVIPGVVVSAFRGGIDDDALTRSNHRVILTDLRGQLPSAETIRLGPYVLVRVDGPHGGAVAEWIAGWSLALADYPVADDRDYGDECFREFCAEWPQGRTIEQLADIGVAVDDWEALRDCVFSEHGFALDSVTLDTWAGFALRPVQS